MIRTANLGTSARDGQVREQTRTESRVTVGDASNSAGKRQVDRRGSRVTVEQVPTYSHHVPERRPAQVVVAEVPLCHRERCTRIDCGDPWHMRHTVTLVHSEPIVEVIPVRERMVVPAAAGATHRYTRVDSVHLSPLQAILGVIFFAAVVGAVISMAAMAPPAVIATAMTVAAIAAIVFIATI